VVVMQAFIVNIGQEEGCVIAFGRISVRFRMVSVRNSPPPMPGVILGSGRINNETDVVEFVVVILTLGLEPEADISTNPNRQRHR
jgi:hypothetical protein